MTDAVCPPRVTVAVSLRGPLTALLVSHEYQSVVPVVLWLVITVPSTESVNVLFCPHAAVVDSPTVCVPLTIAPAFG